MDNKTNKMKTLKEIALERNSELGKTHIEDLNAADKVIAGDKNAFTMIYNKHFPALLWSIMASTGYNEELSKDLAIEAMTKVYENLDKFNPEMSNLATWIINVGKNHMRNYFRLHPNRTSSFEQLGFVNQEGAVKVFEAPSLDMNPEATMSNKERVQLILSFVEKLKGCTDGSDYKKPNFKLAIELVDLQNMSYEEAAGEMGVSISSLKLIVLRARKELKEMLMNSGIITPKIATVNMIKSQFPVKN
jgi:RNA polymerase sigma-70 factor (ECF subfamily)